MAKAKQPGRRLRTSPQPSHPGDARLDPDDTPSPRAEGQGAVHEEVRPETGPEAQGGPEATRRKKIPASDPLERLSAELQAKMMRQRQAAKEDAIASAAQAQAEQRRARSEEFAARRDALLEDAAEQERKRAAWSERFDALLMRPSGGDRPIPGRPDTTHDPEPSPSELIPTPNQGIEGRDQQKLLDALKASPAGLTKSEISITVFRRHKKAADIEAMLDELLKKGLVSMSEDASAGGRRAERWHCEESRLLSQEEVG
jgi:hypothetical protein